MGGKTPHLEGEGWVELIIFQLNNFDSCTRQISASFGIFNIFINLKQVLKDRGLLLKSNEWICAFIKKNVTVDVNEHEQMISFHGYFVFLLIDHTDWSHVNETFHPISATPQAHRGFYFLNHGRFSRIPADCHFRALSIDFSPYHSSFTASLLVIPVSSVFGYQRKVKVYYSFCFGDFVPVWRQKCTLKTLQPK